MRPFQTISPHCTRIGRLKRKSFILFLGLDFGLGMLEASFYTAVFEMSVIYMKLGKLKPFL